VGMKRTVLVGDLDMAWHGVGFFLILSGIVLHHVRYSLFSNLCLFHAFEVLDRGHPSSEQYLSLLI